MSLILGIDQSTSATKVMLFEQSGKLLDKTSLNHEQIYPQPGWVEHDADEIWSNLGKALRQLCEKNSSVLNEVVGLSIANQRETYVVFDRKTGEPLHNAIVWQCRRGDAICQELTEAGHGEIVEAKTGLKLDTYFPASKIAWLLRENPEVAEKLNSGEAVVSTVDAYLVHRLTGGEHFATDPTNASRTLLYDVNQLCWDESLCNLFSVPISALPEVRNCDANFGETDACGTLSKKVPICGVMGDSQAALFAQRCYEPGTGKATFGTGTSVMVNAGHNPIATKQGAVLALAWVVAGQPTYALEGIINYSSATIAWLKDQIGLLEDAAECEALALQVEDNGGVYLVPAFAGLSAPYWNAEARAAIVGMSGHTQKAHIVRAAVESISYQIHDVLEMIRTEADIVPKLMRADGGPTANNFLMQFTADMTQTNWEVSGVPEASALGAAMAGMLGLGMVSSLDELASLALEGKQYSPNMPAGQVQELHSGWQRAVQRVL